MSEGHPGRSESMGPNKRMVPSYGGTGASKRGGAAHTQHRYGCIIGPSLTLYDHFCAEAKKNKKKTTLRYL